MMSLSMRYLERFCSEYLDSKNSYLFQSYTACSLILTEMATDHDLPVEVYISASPTLIHKVDVLIPICA